MEVAATLLVRLCHLLEWLARPDRDLARADIYDYSERFYNPKRRRSAIGYLRPMEFERMAELA